MNKSTNIRAWLQVCLLLLACLIVYWNSLTSTFVWDDTILIENNRHIQRIQNIPLFFTPEYWNRIHPAAGQKQFRPMRTFTLAVDYFFWQDNPVGYHLTNLILHMINVWLVYYLVSLLPYRRPNQSIPNMNRAGPGQASVFWSLPLMTALFFAVHPVHTETIVFIKNRSELLASLFCLAAFVLFIKQFSRAGRVNPFLPAGLLLCFGAALLSKETALVLPGLILFFWVCFHHVQNRRLIIYLIVTSGSLIPVWFWFRHTFLVSNEAAAGVPAMSAWHHFLLVIKTLGIYLTLLIMPTDLSAEHLLTVPTTIMEPAVFISLLALMFAGLLFFTAWRYSRLPVFAGGWIFLTLIPASNLVFLKTRPLAEQRLYLPSLGFCFLLAWIFERLSISNAIRSRKMGRAAVWAICFLLMTAYATGAVKRNFVWHDALSLFSHTVKAAPQSARIQYNMGVALMQKNRLEEAIYYYKNAIRIQPTHYQAHFNLAVVLVKSDRKDEATRHFKQSVSLNPDDVVARVELAVALADDGLSRKAEKEFESARRLEPDISTIDYLAGIAWMYRKRFDLALDCFNRSLEADPKKEEMYPYLVKTLSSLGLASNSDGNFARARDYLRRAIDISRMYLPYDSPDISEIYNNLGVVHKNAGDFEQAITNHRKALAIRMKYLGPDHPDTAMTYNNLGQVMAELGNIDQAIDCYRKALLIFHDRLGPGHPYTRTVTNNLMAITGQSVLLPDETPPAQ